MPIPHWLAEEFRSYCSKLYGLTPDERVFYMTCTSLNKELTRCTRIASLPDIRVHDLRHPYVKHTTKKYNSEKQKTQTTNLSADSLGFLFLLFILRLCP